jgi:hypothetical protein
MSSAYNKLLKSLSYSAGSGKGGSAAASAAPAPGSLAAKYAALAQRSVKEKLGDFRHDDDGATADDDEAEDVVEEEEVEVSGSDEGDYSAEGDDDDEGDATESDAEADASADGEVAEEEDEDAGDEEDGASASASGLLSEARRAKDDAKEAARDEDSGRAHGRGRDGQWDETLLQADPAMLAELRGLRRETAAGRKRALASAAKEGALEGKKAAKAAKAAAKAKAEAEAATAAAAPPEKKFRLFSSGFAAPAAAAAAPAAVAEAKAESDDDDEDDDEDAEEEEEDAELPLPVAAPDNYTLHWDTAVTAAQARALLAASPYALPTSKIVGLVPKKVRGSAATAAPARSFARVDLDALAAEAASAEAAAAPKSGKKLQQQQQVSALAEATAATASGLPPGWRALWPSGLLHTAAADYSLSSDRAALSLPALPPAPAAAASAAAASASAGPGAALSFVSLGTRDRLAEHWSKKKLFVQRQYGDEAALAATTTPGAGSGCWSCPAQQTLAALCAAYVDVLWTHPTSWLEPADEARARDVVLAHVAAHVTRARDRVLLHDAVLAERSKLAKIKQREVRALQLAETEKRALERARELDQAKAAARAAAAAPRAGASAGDGHDDDGDDAGETAVAIQAEAQVSRHERRLRQQKNETAKADRAAADAAFAASMAALASADASVALTLPAPADDVDMAAADDQLLRTSRFADAAAVKTKAGAGTGTGTGASASLGASGAGSTAAAAADEDRFRDQGYTRPRVLILAPMRCQAHALVKRLLQLLPPHQRSHVYNLKRFDEEFGDGDGFYAPDSHRPADFKATFPGNNDDCFRVGISLSNTAVKLFAPFYAADIIVASPLGLRLITGNEGDRPDQRDTDFLSSIEVCVLDSAHIYTMQNMQHLLDVMAVLNGVPYRLRDADFARIRPWALDGLARFYRQTLVLGNVQTAQLHALFAQYCENRAGRVRVRPAEYPGVLGRVRPRVRHVFARQDTLGVAEEAAKNKFDRFITDLWPKIKESCGEGGTLIFFPSYFDFIRARNHFKKRYVSFAAISEFSDSGVIGRARNNFLSGKVKFLLVTERFHFYRRFALRGVRHVVWYGLPTLSHFYADFLNCIALDAAGRASATANSSLVFYSPRDALALERVVGSDTCGEMLTAQNAMHIYG